MTDDELRALQEQAFQLEELTRHPGWEVLRDYLESVLMRGDKFRVLNGHMETIEEYKFTTGVLRGIHAVLDTPGHVRNQVSSELQSRADQG